MHLKSDLCARFQDIRPLIRVLHFVDNPFVCDITTTAIKMQLLGGDEAAVQLEIIDLQHNTALQHRQNDCTPTEFWMKYVPGGQFPEIVTCCKKVLTMFGSTYVCEAGFSAMNNIKSKKRNSLTDNTWKTGGQQSLSISLRSKESLQHSRVKFLIDISNVN